MRFLFVCDSVRQPVTGAGRMSLTLLRELVSQGHEVVGLDWKPNPLVESITGRCVVLPPRLPWARTALWHFTLLRRIPSLHLAHDWVLDPTAYPDVLGHHPHLALFVLDLSPLRPQTYKAFKRTWFRLLYGRSLTKAKTLWSSVVGQIVHGDHRRHRQEVRQGILGVMVQIALQAPESSR